MEHWILLGKKKHGLLFKTVKILRAIHNLRAKWSLIAIPEMANFKKAATGSKILPQKCQFHPFSQPKPILLPSQVCCHRVHVEQYSKEKKIHSKISWIWGMFHTILLGVMKMKKTTTKKTCMYIFIESKERRENMIREKKRLGADRIPEHPIPMYERV